MFLHSDSFVRNSVLYKVPIEQAATLGAAMEVGDTGPRKNVLKSAKGQAATHGPTASAALAVAHSGRRRSVSKAVTGGAECDGIVFICFLCVQKIEILLESFL